MHARTLLRASDAELSAAVPEAIAAESERVSAEDFHWLQAIVGRCPLGQNDRIPLAALSLYFVILACGQMRLRLESSYGIT